MISILAIDERQEFLDTLSNLFQRKGDIHVSRAASMDEAQRKSEVEIFDVILANAEMVDKGVLGFIDSLRSQYIDTPFIGYVDDGRPVRNIDSLIERADYVIRGNVDEPSLFLEMHIVLRSLVKRREVEKALRKRETDFRNIVSNNFDAMVVLDGQGRVVYVNPSAESLFNISYNDFVGKLFGFPIITSRPVDIYILKEFKSFIAVEMRMVEVEWDGKPSYLISLRDITEHILYEESLLKSRDDMENMVRERTSELSESNDMLHREIRERQRMESRLRDSEYKFRRLVEIAHEGILSLDDRAFISFVNPRMAEMLGYTPQEMHGKPVFHFFGEEDHAMFREVLKRLKKGMRQTIDLRLTKKDDGNIDSIINLSPVIKGGDKYEGAVITVNDITQRKLDEVELKDAKAQSELYLDLMGHDINNMNQIGMGYVELAMQTNDIDEIKTLLTRPLEVMKNTSQIIDNVRKLRKLKTENILTDMIDLCALLTKVQEQYSHVRGRDVTINYRPRQECKVMANGLIMDVFSNIVDNAIKHSDPSKPLTIDIDVNMTKENDRSYYVCSIQDNGPGIPAWVKDKIFMRFHRGETKAHGKGLGLHIVKVLVDEFKGKIWVEDRVPGDHTKGVKFVIALPAVK